jgi:electron transfer flavoprotein alpha subunit
MATLLVAEVQNGVLAVDSLAKTLLAVKDLGPVHVLVPGPRDIAETAAGLAGVDKVLFADAPAYLHPLPETIAALVTGVAGDYSHIAAGASAFTKSMLPRVAAMLDVMIISDATAVIDAETFERPIYAGNAIQTVRSIDPVKVFTVRTAAFAPASMGSAQAPVEEVVAPPDPGLSRWVEDRTIASNRPELANARIVVSGGRGLGSKENFAIVEALADRLGGAIGASRAAVDAGYAPNDLQVGQTGKVVAPDLYIAIGISGAIQHVAGMKGAKVIVAINKDEDAPIFQIADFGLVGDLFAILPDLQKALD